MCFRLIQLLFAFGKFLALTPSKIDGNKESYSLKTYRILFFSILMSIQATLIISASRSTWDPVILASFVCLHSMAQTFNILIIIITIFFKRDLWRQLFQSLKSAKVPTTKKVKKISSRLYLLGIVSACFAFEILYYCVLSDFMDLGQLLENELPKSIYFFLFFYYSIMIYSVLKIFLSKYKKICLWLMFHNKRKNINCIFSIKKIAKSMYILKASVDIFNSLFGWPLLVIIAYSVVKFISVSVLIVRQSINNKFDSTIVPNFVRLVQTFVR